MVNPTTVNVGLVVPNTGADVDLWGANDLNPDFIALDGLIAGVQTIGVTNVPVTLTSPAGFVPTPGGGPTQSQNRVLRFTGVMTGNVTITLPIPGSYIIENLTTGAFVLSFRGVTATEVLAVDQGNTTEVYNDGANVRFVGLGNVGAMEMWAGLSAVPAWVTACTKPPYLLCNGSVHNFTESAALGARLTNKFGGNGVTTFGVPDMQGRVPLAYDGTGARITAAGCGLNGQTIGAALDQQTQTLTAAQIPAHTHGVTDNGHQHQTGPGSPYRAANSAININTAGATPVLVDGGIYLNLLSTGINITGISINANTGGGGAHPNVQPSIVTGIWVIKT